MEARRLSYGFSDSFGAYIRVFYRGVAKAWCQTAKPDVILLDYLLPGADGLAILHGLQQHTSPDSVGEGLPLPVVMLTGKATRE